MAWTSTKVAQYNQGNYAIQQWQLLSDAATLELSTGLKNIVNVIWAGKTLTTAGVKFKANILSAGTTSLGTLAITGATAADEFYVTIIGN